MTATVLLPGGHVDDDGQVHREAELVPLSGRDEERLAECDPSAPPHFLTALLTRCLRRLGAISPVSRDVVRRLLVADRLYLALKARELMYGSRVQATIRCPWKECRQRVDIDFRLEDIPVHASIEKGPLFTRVVSVEASGGQAEECEVTFRLPNGGDQEALFDAAEGQEGDLVELLLTRCVQHAGSLVPPGSGPAGRLSSDSRAEITRHMETLAPTIDLTLAACCPECEREFSVPFDIQGMLLAECKDSRERLYREVHELAYHYHWSEGDIMALSRDKRRTYLALLSKEARRVRHAV